MSDSSITSHVPNTTATARLARFVLTHRRLVVLLWLLLLPAGIYGASHVSNRLKGDFSLPGQPGYETAQKITHLYGNGGDTTPTVVVVTLPRGQTAARDARQLGRAFDQARAAVPRDRIVEYSATRDPRFITADGRSTFALLFTGAGKGLGGGAIPGALMDSLSRALPPGSQVGFTGLDHLANGGSSKGPGVLVETLIGAAGALAVLAFVFASMLALLPLLIAASSILTTLLVVLGVTTFANVSFIVLFLVSLVGLGVAIDYSLLIVTRWREEREHGRDNHDAVGRGDGHRRARGRPIRPDRRDRAAVADRAPGTGAAQCRLRRNADPARIHRRGADAPTRTTWRHRATRRLAASAPRSAGQPRVDRLDPRRRPRPLAGSSDRTRRPDRADHPRVQPDHRRNSGPRLRQERPSPRHLPTAARGRRAQRHPDPDRSPHPHAIRKQRDRAARPRSGNRDGRSLDRLRQQPRRDHCAARYPPRRDRQRQLARTGQRRPRAVRSTPGVIDVAGNGAIELDYQHAVFGNFPLMFAVIAVLTIALLARAFRSVVLAVKAVLLNLISMAATFGVITWFWQQGHGSSAVFGIPATGAITFWIPLMVFAFLFGLSMDYEVFILARVREECDRTGSTDAAIVEGLGRTGRLVTSAALILFLAFASLASAPNTDVKVLATGLGVGILLDATLVRALLLPALVSLFGRFNWRFPRPLARVLRVSRPPRLAIGAADQ